MEQATPAQPSGAAEGVLPVSGGDLPGDAPTPPADGAGAAPLAAAGAGLPPPVGAAFTVATPLMDIMQWAGIPADSLRDSALAYLGDPTHSRDIAYITEAEWADFVNSEFVRLPLGDEGAPAQVAATAVQKARLRAWRRGAREALGHPAVDPAPTGATRALPQAAAAPAEPPLKKLRMSQLVDVSSDTECTALGNEKINAMFSNYRSTRGDLPHQDIEPTADQLSAIYQLLATGAPPYVDFSIFGPHGMRVGMSGGTATWAIFGG